MRGKVNAYLASLIITVAGGGAALLIVHLANSDTLASSFGSSGGTEYAELERSILRNKN